MHANKMRLNKLNDSVLTVNYTVEREREEKKGRKQQNKEEEEETSKRI